MADLNRIHLIGRLGTTPELKDNKKGITLTELVVATSHVKRTGPDQSQESVTQWHHITVFGKQAEQCTKYLNKGDLVSVEAELRYSVYKDGEGKTKRGFDIVADEVRFLSKINRGRHLDATSETATLSA